MTDALAFLRMRLDTTVRDADALLADLEALPAVVATARSVR